MNITMVIPLHKFKAAAVDDIKLANVYLGVFFMLVWNSDPSFTET